VHAQYRLDGTAVAPLGQPLSEADASAVVGFDADYRKLLFSKLPNTTFSLTFYGSYDEVCECVFVCALGFGCGDCARVRVSLPWSGCVPDRHWAVRPGLCSPDGHCPPGAMHVPLPGWPARQWGCTLLPPLRVLRGVHGVLQSAHVFLGHGIVS
jgi:hypothetical protein